MIKKNILPTIATLALCVGAGIGISVHHSHASSPKQSNSSSSSQHALSSTQAQKQIVAYMLATNDENWANLQNIASNPSQYKFTRLVLSFINPRLTYAPGSNSLSGTGLFNNMANPPSVATLAGLIKEIQDAGKQVFISVGGWDYSAGGDGSTGDLGFDPTTGSDGGYLYYQTLLLYPTGTNYPLDANGNCNTTGTPSPSASNSWCYVIEPQGQPQNFSSFAYPADFPASSLPAGVVTDSKPYQAIVDLATALGVKGIDIDFEEFWMADWYRQDFNVDTGSVTSTYDRDPKSAGPFVMPLAVQKYAYIADTLEKDAQGKFLISTAAPAVGAIPIQGKWGTGEQWWGGNLKGLIYNVAHYNDNTINGTTVITGLTGGIGAMTYDLSPKQPNQPLGLDSYSSLQMQVAFYMNSYLVALKGIVDPSNLFIGVEIGQTAFPKNLPDQLRLMQANSGTSCAGVAGGCDINQIFAKTTLPPTPGFNISDYWQPTYDPSVFGGMILWEQFKPATPNTKEISVTDAESYYNDNFINPKQ